MRDSSTELLIAPAPWSTPVVESPHQRPLEPVAPVTLADAAGGIAPQEGLTVLHVGCGLLSPEKLPMVFRQAGWRELRLDIDPDVRPDFIASTTDMGVIADGLVDAVYSAHNVEHLYPHEVNTALSEMRRVLKPGGIAFITLPDLQEVARHIAEGKLEDTLYVSPMGPIAPLDIVFGHRASMEAGNTFMAHRTGFTDSTLAGALIKAGFAAVLVQRDTSSYNLSAIAFRTAPSQDDVTLAQSHMTPNLPSVLYKSATP